MKFNTKTSIFREAINKVLTVVDKRNSRPILTFCYLKAHNNFIELQATDLEVSVKVQFEANVQNFGSLCVNAKNIFDILRELPEDNLEIAQDETQNLLTINSKNISYKLVTSSSEDFPSLSFSNEDYDFSLRGDEVQEIISRTAHAISNDETRIFFNGIFLQEVNSRLRAVSTDGHRLALLENKTLNQRSEPLENGVIIPKKGVYELKKMAEFYLDSELKFKLNESFIHITAGENYSLSIRLIARDFPKYQAVIPSKTTFKVTIDKELLVGAVKRIKILANEKSNAVKFHLNNNSLNISANHPILGQANEQLDVDYTGNEIEMSFNAKYLSESFSVINDAEITMEFNNEISPVIIRADRDQDFLGIIMPLKL